MARYKVSFTVYKNPAGKTMMGPTALHFLGDLCSAVGLMGILFVILALMDSYGVGAIAGGVVAAVAGFVLMAVLHKKAKQNAQTAYLKALAEMGAGPDQAPPQE